MCHIYTKTFGGKIGKNLHSVSPDNFLDKNFKGGNPLIFFRQKISNIYHPEHKGTKKSDLYVLSFSVN